MQELPEGSDLEHSQKFNRAHDKIYESVCL